MFHEGPNRSASGSRYGINLRMADPHHLDGITVNMRDGAAGTWGLLYTYEFSTSAPDKPLQPTPLRGAAEFAC